MKKNRKAQQLVEFVLVAPVLIMILVVIVEVGYAINTKISLGESIKLSIPALNQLYNQTSSKEIKLETMRASLEESMKNYFDSHNLPNSDSIKVSIVDPTNSFTAVVTATYSYEPIFTLPNLFDIQIIPDSYNFSSSQVISKSLLSESTFNSALSSYDLSSFGKSTGLFDSRTSALRSYNIGSVDFRNNLAILLSFKLNNGDPEYKYARLFNWWGEDLLPQNEIIDITTGNLAIKSPYYSGGSWIDTKIPYTWIISGLGFTQAIFTKTENPLYSNNRLLLSGSDIKDNLTISWCDQGSSTSGLCSGDISGTSIDNYGKRGLSLLYNSVSDAYGTFDNAICSVASTEAKPVKSIIIPNEALNFILRLYLPSSALKPNDSKNGYSASFFIDTNGQLSTSGTSTAIQDVYLDNDGDAIPNAWDTAPDYVDIDGNLKIDGEQASISSEIIDLPTNKTVAELSVGQVFNSSVNGNVLCSGISTPKVYYIITSNSSISSMDGISVPYRTASPFNINGTAKTSTLNTPYIPSFDSVDLNKISYNKITRTTGNPCAESTQALGTFIYYNKSNILSRKMTSWAENSVPKNTYFYNTSTSTSENNLLNTSAFKYKVSVTR